MCVCVCVCERERVVSTQSQEIVTFEDIQIYGSTKTEEADCVARVRFCSLCESVCSDDDPLLTSFADKALFYLNDHKSTQSNRHQSAGNGILLHEVL